MSVVPHQSGESPLQHYNSLLCLAALQRYIFAVHIIIDIVCCITLDICCYLIALIAFLWTAFNFFTRWLLVLFGSLYDFHNFQGRQREHSVPCLMKHCVLSIEVLMASFCFTMTRPSTIAGSHTTKVLVHLAFLDCHTVLFHSWINILSLVWLDFCNLFTASQLPGNSRNTYKCVATVFIRLYRSYFIFLCI